MAPPCRLMVSGLLPDVGDAELNAIFSPFGALEAVQVGWHAGHLLLGELTQCADDTCVMRHAVSCGCSSLCSWWHAPCWQHCSTFHEA